MWLAPAVVWTGAPHVLVLSTCAAMKERGVIELDVEARVHRDTPGPSVNEEAWAVAISTSLCFLCRNHTSAPRARTAEIHHLDVAAERRRQKAGKLSRPWRSPAAIGRGVRS